MNNLWQELNHLRICLSLENYFLCLWILQNRKLGLVIKCNNIVIYAKNLMKIPIMLLNVGIKDFLKNIIEENFTYGITNTKSNIFI